MKTIFIITITIITLFAPIKVSVRLYYSNDIKKAFFVFYAYGFIKIKSGYLYFIKEGVTIHLTENKAIVIPYKSLFNTKKVIKLYKDYHVNDLNVLAEIGLNNETEKVLSATLIYNFLFNGVTEIVKERKPYVNASSAVNFYLGNDDINFYLNAKIYVNLLTLLINLTKLVMEKILNGKNKRKTQQIHSND